MNLKNWKLGLGFTLSFCAAVVARANQEPPVWINHLSASDGVAILNVDGNQMFQAQGSRLFARDLKLGTLQWETTFSQAIVLMAVSEDGQFFAWVDRLGNVRVYESDDGRELGSFQVNLTNFDIRSLQFDDSKPGALLIQTGGEMVVMILQTGMQWANIHAAQGELETARFCPNGKLRALEYASENELIQRNVLDGDQEFFSLGQGIFFIYSAEISPNCEWALVNQTLGNYLPNQMVLYSLKTHQRVREFNSKDGFYGGAFTPDSQGVLIYDQDSTPKIYPAGSSGDALFTFPEPTWKVDGNHLQMLFSRNGKAWISIERQ